MLVFLLILLFFGATLLLTKFKVTPLLVLFINCATFVVGFYRTDSASCYWLLYYFLILLFVIAACMPLRRQITVGQKSAPQPIYTFNKFFFWTVVFFFAYHFLVGGIPALSANVVTERFNMTSSGLFGVPGRMAQFGTNVLLFYTSYFFFNKKRVPAYKSYDGYFYLSIFLIFLYALFCGIKSSFMGLLFLLIYVLSLRREDFSIKVFLQGKGLAILICLFCVGATYFALMFNKYNDEFSSMNIFDYLLYRLTNATVESGYRLLSKIPRGWDYSNDFLYYIEKYFHVELTNKVVYPLEIYVSNSMSGRVFTTANAYYTPVTIGGLVELFYHFGYLCLLIVPCLGFAFGKLIVKTKREADPLKFATMALLVQFVITFLNKGGLMYYIINYVLLAVIFFGIYSFGNVLNEGSLNRTGYYSKPKACRSNRFR